MVEDTLRGYVAPDWCEALDFSTLTRMNAEYIGPELYNRIGDMLWRVEFREGSPLGGPPLDNGERPYLLVLFEFQSAVDPDMAWRMHEYVYLLQRHQRGHGTLKAEGREAPVLAVVVYNGDRAWTALDERSGPVVEGPSGSGWTGNRTRTYVVLDERALAEGGGGPVGNGRRLPGSRRLPGARHRLDRLPPDNRLTTLIGLETGSAEALPRLLWEAFERYAGEEEKGLREGYHARVRYSRSPHGGERLPSLAEMERVLEARRGGSEMPTLMDARAMEWEARVLERGREQGPGAGAGGVGADVGSGTRRGRGTDVDGCAGDGVGGAGARTGPGARHCTRTGAGYRAGPGGGARAAAPLGGAALRRRDGRAGFGASDGGHGRGGPPRSGRLAPGMSNRERTA